MKVRLVDYVGNFGGGVRFSLELVQAILAADKAISIEIVSCGDVLDMYSNLFFTAGIPFKKIEIFPVEYWRNIPKKILRIPLTSWIMRKFGYGNRWHIPIPNIVFSDCDIVWMPWAPQHRIPKCPSVPVVVSLHDAILFQFPNLISPEFLQEERESLNGLFVNKKVRIVVSSNCTIHTLENFFSVDEDRFDLIPVSGGHVPNNAHSIQIQSLGSWQCENYLMCPANISPHKNHEILFEGIAKWGAGYPLVISGPGTKLAPHLLGRTAILRKKARKLGLEINKHIIPLGYIENDVYFSVLSNCRALVMPSRAEGGGSFPVFEAMQLGIPVICSDIPVLKEQIERTGGDVIWFNVNDSDDLARALIQLESNYDFYKNRAIEQISIMVQRSWCDVANEYKKLFYDIYQYRDNSHLRKKRGV
jgi:glycosyltransferase involved in cell wall biosynthesis